jgi:rare lipoprotein A (peptidoglycan hydrolase)
MADVADVVDEVAVPAVLAPTTPPERISDFAVNARTFAPRPTPGQGAVAKSVAKSVAWPFHPTGRKTGGSATWYCKTGSSACASGYPGGMYAAAGPELRVGAWRGRVVRVCSGGDCIVVKLIDWCACGGSHVIDLYSDAFRRLAPLSSGALKVTVSW